MSECPTCNADAEAQRIHDIEVKAGHRGYVAGWNDAVEESAMWLERNGGPDEELRWAAKEVRKLKKAAL